MKSDLKKPVPVEKAPEESEKKKEAKTVETPKKESLKLDEIAKI